MPKKVLIITASLRAGSNSDALAEAFAQGARDAGHCVEIISLKDKKITFCQGCLACQSTQKCVIQDDAAALAEKSAVRMWWRLHPLFTITDLPDS